MCKNPAEISITKYHILGDTWYKYFRIAYATYDIVLGPLVLWCSASGKTLPFNFRSCCQTDIVRYNLTDNVRTKIVTRWRA